MATFKFEYKLYDAGWAEAIVYAKNKSVNITVSYLHDSLCDLADAAKSLIYGAESVKVIFMDEPGEHQLFFERKDDKIVFEIRWFKDWASWNMYPADKYKVVLSGTTTLDRVTGEILSALKSIYETYGLDKYKELWGEHDFPINEFKQLKLLRATEQPTTEEQQK
ncbi:MAG: hypothetical protein GY754_08355 [bacterium]|nr:hypothetical protein [bacterium]